MHDPNSPASRLEAFDKANVNTSPRLRSYFRWRLISKMVDEAVREFELTKSQTANT